MNFIYRMLWLACIVIVMMMNVGCSPAPTPQSATAVPEPTEVMQVDQMESVISRLQQGHVLRVGVRENAPPWGFLDEDGNHTGFDVELVTEMAQRWGVELTFVSVSASERIGKLAEGEVDLVAAALTHRRDREEFIDFSITYFLDGQALLVKEDSGISDLADLEGKIISVVLGTTGIENIEAQVEQLGLNVAIVDVADHATGVVELNGGAVDAHVTDASILAGFAKQNPGLIVVGGPFSREPYGFGVPINDSSFRDLVNFTLQDMYEDGAYAQLYERWLLGGHADGLNLGDQVFQIERWPLGGVPPVDSTTVANANPTLAINNTWEQIQTSGRVRVGVKTDSPPWGFMDSEGNRLGFDVALMEEMARRWGVEIEFVPVTSADRFEKLADGEADIVAASVTHRRDREELADFSETYFLDGQALLVKNESGITGLEDLDGKIVTVTRGTTGLDGIRKQSKAFGVEVAVVEVDDHFVGLEEVVAGTVDAHITDASILGALAQQTPGLSVVGGPLSNEPYAFAVPAGDSTFRDLVNFTLQDMYDDGTYAQLYETWLHGGHPDGIDIGGQLFEIDLWSIGNTTNYILQR